ncbi:hypothetical protein GCM10027176_77940 [Actinoallomurus bryophytorum]|uniref:Uncharacterized protein n=1 Tax=Actinoallomurus bryophytorum TaxID=1490222 RepID=A0A543CR88_9ACTN|nr:hypothetical protein [Actinoallomurus bryophytorum]TQL99625.1 hypothetical protein FB559_5322 [Actinoallomurus bryophytorum]
MPDEIVVKDSDDRSERMINNPDRYFAEARERAEREVRREAEVDERSGARDGRE